MNVRTNTEKKVRKRHDDSNDKLSLKRNDGMHFNFLKDKWSLSKDLSVNYISCFIKN